MQIYVMSQSEDLFDSISSDIKSMLGAIVDDKSFTKLDELPDPKLSELSDFHKNLILNRERQVASFSIVAFDGNYTDEFLLGFSIGAAILHHPGEDMNNLLFFNMDNPTKDVKPVINLPDNKFTKLQVNTSDSDSESITKSNESAGSIISDMINYSITELHIKFNESTKFRDSIIIGYAYTAGIKVFVEGDLLDDRISIFTN